MAIPVLRIILASGHGFSNTAPGVYDPGAIGCEVEARLVAQLADEVLALSSNPSVILAPTCDAACLAKKHATNGRKPESHLQYTIRWVNQTQKPFDFLISLHANWAPSATTSGVEVLYSNLASETRKKQAAAASRALSAALGIPDRGAKPALASQHGKLGILDKTKPPALLFEMGFVTNPTDMDRVKECGALAILSAIEAIQGVK